MPVTYLFEVRQIQNYIFATNKLRDATGASELIDTIASDDAGGTMVDPGCLAGQVLQQVGLTPLAVNRATGGVLEMTVAEGDRGKLTQFRAALRLHLASSLPGLTWSDAIGESSEAARKSATGGMVQSEIWPMIGPMQRPAPLSGGVPARAGELTDKEGRCCKTKAFADLPTLMKRANEDKDQLAAKFLPAATGKDYHWPVEFPDDSDPKQPIERVFPFAGKGMRRVALLHADGNGMGKLFQTAGEHLIPGKTTRDLSRAIAAATRAAVHAAMTATVVPAASDIGVLPCRPILLGGDDVTVILRADLALPFAQHFLPAFEAETRKALNTCGLKDGLTAKIGIVFLAPNQPFGAAHRLCESLAGSAKDDTCSKVAFWRLTSSAIPQDVKDLDRMAKGANELMLRRKAHDLADLERLANLAALLAHDAVGGGALRRVPELLRTDPAAATRVYERALDVIKTNAADVHAKLCDALLAFDLTKTSPVNTAGDYSPLWEAHELRQIARLSDDMMPAEDKA